MFEAGAQGSRGEDRLRDGRARSFRGRASYLGAEGRPLRSPAPLLPSRRLDRSERQPRARASHLAGDLGEQSASTSAQAESAAPSATSTRSRSASRHVIMSERPRRTPSEPRAWRKFLQELRRRRNLPVGRPADPALGDRARDRRAPIASRIRALDAAAGQAAARHPDAPLALDTWPDSSAGCGRSGCTSSS